MTAALTDLLVHLLAARAVHQSNHWRFRYLYGDHLLFQRLYEGIDDEIDDVAEKVMGYGGSAALDAARLLSAAGRLAADVQRDAGRGKSSYAIEALLLRRIEQVFSSLEREKKLPLGANDLLAALANAHEKNVYLLQRVQLDQEKIAAAQRAGFLAEIATLGLR